MKNSLNEIKINLSSNAYIPNEELKDFLFNNYTTYSNKLYNMNGNCHIEKFPSSFSLNRNRNKQIGNKNYRDLLNMSLQNKKIVVNKMGIKKRKNENSQLDQKIYNSVINEKIIDFKKKFNKNNQTKIFDKNNVFINIPNKNTNQSNKINLTLELDKRYNRYEMFNKLNNSNISNRVISGLNTNNISYEKKMNKKNGIRCFSIKEQNSVNNFEQKIFKNVFNKFMEILNNYCRLILKYEFFRFFQTLKSKKKDKLLSMSKIYYQNIYNKFSNKSRLKNKNLKSLTLDDSFKNGEGSNSLKKANYEISYDKTTNKNNTHIRTITLSSNNFCKNRNKKNKFNNKYIFNNLTNKLNNKSYDNENNLFNSKIVEINPLYKKSNGNLNIHNQNYYSKDKVLDRFKSKNMDNIYSRKIIFNSNRMPKKPFKKLDTNYIKSTTDQLSNRMNDDKKLSFKKSEFIINLFLKNKAKKKEKRQTKKIEINNYGVQNTFNKNKNDYMFKTINSFYKKKEIKNNKKIIKKNEIKEESTLSNDLDNLNQKERKKTFFSKFKNYRYDKKDVNNNTTNNNDINKVYSIGSVTTCVTSEDKYSMDNFYFIKNGHKLKKSKKINLNRKIQT